LHRGIYCDIYICAYNTSLLDFPLHHSPLFIPSPPLRTISIGLILLFSHTNTKYIHHVHPQTPFPCAHPPLTGPHPQKRPVLPSCPSFFLLSVYGQSKGVLLWYFRPVYIVLYSNYFLITYSFSVTMLP
jgi:hypothetical protein